MQEVKFKFYNVEKCGYYHYGEKEVAFSSLSDTLVKLAAWAGDGREFINTETYEAAPDEDILRTLFCGFAVDSHSQDAVLVLWNETNNDDGKIYGINPMEKPGSNKMLSAEFESETIPGFPSYFWFIPAKKLCASIKFDHSRIGKTNLDHYIRGYLQFKSPYKLLVGDDKVVAYAQDGKSSDSQGRTKPYFLLSELKQLDLEAELLENFDKITKIIQTQKLQYQLPNDKTFLEIFWDKIDKLVSDDDETGDDLGLTTVRQVTQELSFKPTKKCIEKVLKSYQDQTMSPSVSRIGFGYGDGTRIMLNGTNVSFKEVLDISYNQNTIISARKLLSLLTTKKIELLKNLDTPSFTKETGSS